MTKQSLRSTTLNFLYVKLDYRAKTMEGLNLLVVSVLSRAFVAGTPLLFGTLGEIYAERAGILNLGVEGMISVGAVSAFGVAYTTGNPWLGLLAGGLAAAFLALI
ncbi:MAG: rbsC2, partial [Candidatus Brocadiaceae bacterium]|nr:rbsC2 [Candidatus Brocadiaceae bacterium]